MKNKVTSGIMLTLLLTGMLILTFKIQPVKASGTIYIRADGSIVPDTAPISSVDNATYTFIGNIYDEIVVERSNIIIDGGGYTVAATPNQYWAGISLCATENVTVKNTNIKESYYGAILNLTSQSVISGNNISGCAYGIQLNASPNNTISRNNMENMLNIFLDDSSNNVISENNITRGEIGIRMEGSSNNTIYGNNILTFSPTSYAIQLFSSSSNNIYGNNIGYGMFLSLSHNNSISGNIIGPSGAFGSPGIEFGPSPSNNNVVCANTISSVRVRSGFSNIFYHNNLGPPGLADSQGGLIVWDNGYPSGGNYWTHWEISGPPVDLFRGPYQNETGSDGISDIPFIGIDDARDNYPLMNPWTPTETSVDVQGVDHQVTIVSNTTIDQIVATSNTLHFKSSGPEGEKGYVNVIFPIVNTTAIKVFIDGEKLTPPPFPVINSDGTHYFIYFEFTLSAHSIGIQFAPFEYTLTVSSSPTGVTFTVDGVSRTTPWSGTYSEGASVSLVMPETHDGYVWSHWLEDGDLNRIKTVTMDTDITLTAVYEPAPKPVGGKTTPINIPLNKPETPTLWIWLTTIILSLVVTVFYVKKRKRDFK